MFKPVSAFFKRIAVIGVLALGFAPAALVLAQVVVPNVVAVQPADRFVDIVGGQPSAQSSVASPAQMDSLFGYAKVSQAETSSAFTYSATIGQSYLLLTGAQLTTGTVTINFPPAPPDGTKFCLRSVAGVTSGATIAYGPSSATFTSTPTSFSAATSYCYLYSLVNATWDPI